MHTTTQSKRNLYKMKATKCKAMDTLGKSDPYVIFASSPPKLLQNARDGKANPATRVVAATLDPEWKDTQVPNLLVGSSSREQLDNAHIIIAVIDYDVGNPDDPMGYAIIPLSRLSRATGPVEFREQLIYHGQLDAGTITGTLTMLWPNADGSRPEGSVVGHGAAKGCCTIM